MSWIKHNPLRPIDVSDAELIYRKNHPIKKSDDLELSAAMKCTVCRKSLHALAHRGERAISTHPLLNVFMCDHCLVAYDVGYPSGDFPIDPTDGSEIYCRWCGDGGGLNLCKFCISAYCDRCISTNLSRKELKKIKNRINWKCFACYVRPIYKLRHIAAYITEKMVGKMAEQAKRSERLSARMVKRQALAYADIEDGHDSIDLRHEENKREDEEEDYGEVTESDEEEEVIVEPDEESQIEGIAVPAPPPPDCEGHQELAAAAPQRLEQQEHQRLPNQGIAVPPPPPPDCEGHREIPVAALQRLEQQEHQRVPNQDGPQMLQEQFNIFMVARDRVERGNAHLQGEMANVQDQFQLMNHNVQVMNENFRIQQENYLQFYASMRQMGRMLQQVGEEEIRKVPCRQ